MDHVEVQLVEHVSTAPLAHVALNTDGVVALQRTVGPDARLALARVQQFVRSLVTIAVNSQVSKFVDRPYLELLSKVPTEHVAPTMGFIQDTHVQERNGVHVAANGASAVMVSHIVFVRAVRAILVLAGFSL